VREEDGVRVFETPNWTWPGIEKDDGWGPLGILARLRLVLSERFDWVYSFAHSPNCAVPALWAVRNKRARLALDWCDDFAGGVFPRREELRAGLPRPRPLKWTVQRWAERREARAEKRLLLRAEKVTVISQTLRDKAIGYGAAPENVRLVRSGADLQAFAPLPRDEARRLLGLPAELPLLTYLANYHPDEAFLFDALDRVFERDRRARLAFTGPPFTDPRSRMPRFASRLIPLGRLKWEHVPAAIAAGQVALVPLPDTPHNRARCPQKLMDCLASGRPVVTCAVGETGRIFNEHPGIGLASAPTSEAFAEAVLTALCAPPHEREAMGRRARQAAETEFSWERAAEEIDRFLRSA
jgi:glycosyltransferase involved in cell wall biosynthesis